MPEKERELLDCYRQLPPKDRAAVLSHVHTAQRAENSVKRAFALASPAANGFGKGHERGKTQQG